LGKKMADSKAKAYRQVIRIAKADSAWVYHVLEAHEGIVSYSTLAPDLASEGGVEALTPLGLPTCELALTIPAGFLEEVSAVLEHLKETGVWVHELSQPSLESDWD
jgi:hypothetical protein